MKKSQQKAHLKKLLLQNAQHNRRQCAWPVYGEEPYYEILETEDECRQMVRREVGEHQFQQAQ
jgi:peptide methionine sulfoxide reductase MsrB